MINAGGAVINNQFAAFDRVLLRLQQIGKIYDPKTGLAQCPAHDDRNPSMSIYRKTGKIKLYCHAGCDDLDVLAALGWQVRDLYDVPSSRPLVRHLAPVPSRQEGDQELSYREQEILIKELAHRVCELNALVHDLMLSCRLCPIRPCHSCPRVDWATGEGIV